MKLNSSIEYTTSQGRLMKINIVIALASTTALIGCETRTTVPTSLNQSANSTPASPAENEAIAQMFSDYSKKISSSTQSTKMTPQTKQDEASMISQQSSDYTIGIARAIQAKFTDASLYPGKRCSLKIGLSPEGAVPGVKTMSGDLAFCNAATNAVKTAKLPKFPNAAVYENFKSFAMDFNFVNNKK